MKETKRKPIHKSLQVWDDTPAMSVAAAHKFVNDCQRSIVEHGYFVVALAGGKTPGPFYSLLATSAFSKNIDWQKVFVFFSDERFVAADDADSNYGMIRSLLLDHIPVPASHIFPVPVHGKVEDCAMEYEKIITDFFDGKKPRFHWLMLGMGEDGHTASIFPGSALMKEKKRLVKESFSEAMQNWRVSFTFPLINMAREIVVLTAGASKADTLKQVLEGSDLPAAHINPKKGRVTWIVDKDITASVSNKG